MNPFDPIQSEIEPGLTVIEASAGTGKTFSISHLVPRLILKKEHLRVGEILLVTYTNDAAGELADRTRKVFADLVSDNPPANPTMAALRQKMQSTPGGRERIERAIRELDLLSISTIHSFCQSVLQTEGELCGMPVMPEVEVNTKNLLREALHGIWKNHVGTDQALAEIASALGWKFNDDLSFVTLALGMPEIRVEPNPPEFASLLSRLSKPTGRFAAQELRDLEAFFPTVDWIKAGRTPEFREAVIKTLEEPRDLKRWYEAVRWVADLDKQGGAIKKPRNQDPHSQAAQLQAVQTAKSILQEWAPLTLSWRTHLATLVEEKVATALKNNRLTTFDGMVQTLDNALSARQAKKLQKRLRERFKIALVDESQDTDGAQFRIFEKIFLDSSDHSLVLIGDPKQAIYAFRGADVNTYLAAKNRAAAKVFTLTQTYRSPQSLVDCVNALFGRQRSFHKEDLEFLGSTSGMNHDTWLNDSTDAQNPSARLEAWVVPDSEVLNFSNGGDRVQMISESVASEIARLLGAKPNANQSGANVSPAQISEGDAGKSRAVVPADFAVLVSDRHEGIAIHEALKARGVPAIRKTDEDVLASDEAREIFTLLVAVNAPLQAKTRRAALATRLLGKTDREIRESEENEADETVAKFQLWKQEWARRGISSALALIDASEGASKRLASSPDGERRLTNFRHLTDILSGFAAVSGGKPNRLLIWLEQEIARANESGVPPEERLLQLESDSHAVNITTMHSAKGLEFPLVFCPFLWTSKDLKPYQVLNRKSGFSIVDTKLCDPAVRLETQTNLLEERLRLTYVALTRAKVKLWICAGAAPGPDGGGSALDWLLRSDLNMDYSSWAAGASANRGTSHKTVLTQLAQNLSGGCMVREGLPAVLPSTYSRPFVSISAQDQVVQVPQSFWRTTSFSQLTREKNAKGESHADSSGDDSVPATAVAPNAFESIPGGSVLGTAVHDFLEKWDFESVPLLTDLAKHFASYPLSKKTDELPGAAGEMLAHLRDSILSGLGCKISEACCTRKTSEWQFHLPLTDNFGIDALAEVFRRHEDHEYASALLKLGTDSLDGFLQGFIDKIATHSSAFGVIDWKTNKLPAYDETTLYAAARASHYWLQTHLYLVALRRYLGPEAEIRGAWLVYLRGVREGSSQGILHIQPTAELLNDLAKLFAQPAYESRNRMA